MKEAARVGRAPHASAEAGGGHLTASVRRRGWTGTQRELLAMQDAAGNRAVCELLHRTSGGAGAGLDGGGHGGADPDSPLAPLPGGPSPAAARSALPPIVRSVLDSGAGEPLDPTTRAFMQSRFGYDFVGVRLHTGPRASRSAHAVGAAAYTVGRDIVIAEGDAVPRSAAEVELLAHELAHTIQQDPASPEPPPLAPASAAEVAAAAASRQVAGGEPVTGSQPTTGVGLSRAARSAHFLSDDELLREIDAVNDRLLEPRSYAGREADEQWYEELMRVLGTRRNIDPARMVSRPKPSRPSAEAAVPEAPAPGVGVGQAAGGPAVEASGGGLARPAASRQYADLIKIAQERISYAVRAPAAARGIMEHYASGQITAEAAEQAAINARRQLESQTRTRMPGPEPAQTVNEMAARRNIQRYGDPLGYRDPAHLRQHNPQATTNSIIRGAGRPNVRVSGLGVAGGALGVVGGILAVEDLRNAFAGRTQVDLPGLDPGDFEVGQEFRNVYLGEDEHGSGWRGTIRVERNIIFRKRFFLVRAYIMA